MPQPRPHPLLLLALCTLILLRLPAARADALSGSWALDAKASDDPEDEFDGKLRRLPFPTPATLGGDVRPQHGDPRRDRIEAAQEAYWDQIRQTEERRSLRNFHRLGTVYPLLTAERLEITPARDGYEILYDGDLPREVRPNAAGRVFSASGDELVADTFGHTLSYYEGTTLVLETDPPDGGKYFEYLSVSADRLEYRFKVDLRVLTEPVEVRRVFVRSAAAPR